MKRAELNGQDQGAILFGSNVRRELVLVDLIREALVDDPSGSYNQDLSVLQLPRALGPLEAEVMEVVWQKTEATVRDVHQVLSRRREIAYTTVLTVLRNLYRKGMVERRQGEAAYIYYPRSSREEFVQARVGEIIDLLFDHFPVPTMTYLLRRMEKEKR